MGFRLVVNYRPRGDQETAIAELTRGIRDGEQHQVLLGVTGSGKTFTMAKVMEAIGRPALVLAHNKTLAAQLYHEFKSFFPDNAVEYFVSYYDYYQPEAYIPASDVYIEKEATINDELDKLRLSATKSLFERRDCVIVASVSCIYGLGSPEAYYGMLLMLEKGQKISRNQIVSKLVEILYERNDIDFRRGTFRVRGDVIEVYPTYDDYAYRIELWGDEIESLSQIDPLLGQVKQTYQRLPIYPKTHYVMSEETKLKAMESIRDGARLVAQGTGKAGEAHRSAAALPAHHVRPGDDERDRLLPRDRELLAPFFGAAAGRSAADAAGLPAARCGDVPRRKPPDDSATARDVPRRPVAQRDAGIARIPAAERAGQPSSDVRGVRAPRQPIGLRFGDAGAVRADEIGGRGGGADHTAHGAGGPERRDPAGEGAGGRLAGRDPQARGRPASGCW